VPFLRLCSGKDGRGARTREHESYAVSSRSVGAVVSLDAMLAEYKSGPAGGNVETRAGHPPVHVVPSMRGRSHGGNDDCASDRSREAARSIRQLSGLT